MKKLFLLLLLLPSLTLALDTNIMRNILPETTQKFDLGSTTPSKEWNGIYTKNLYISGTCTGCGTGGSGSFPFTPTSYGVSTSTTIGFTNGILVMASSTFMSNTYFPSGIWDSSGNVGIGTTSPYSLLSVAGRGVFQSLIATSTTEFSGIGTSTPGTLLSIQGIVNFDTATSTFSSSGGINLKSGCLTYNGGACIGAGSMVYPGAGIALSTGSAWGTSITDNSQKWNSATTTFGSPLTYTQSTNIASIQAASASQAGSMAAVDYQRLYTATSTFSAPLLYTLSTNAVTCTTATGSVAGCLAAVDFSKFNSATTTFGSPLTYTQSTNIATIQAASGSQNGYLALGDYNLIHAATTTFGTPLTYTQSTNVATIQAASGSQNGYLALGDYNLIHAATTTFSAPLTYTQNTNIVTCAAATASVPGCLAAVDFSRFNTATTTAGTGLTYTLSTNAFTLNLGNANTWTALQTMANTGTTTFSGGIESGTKIAAPYFNATSTTATSTLMGGLIVGGTNIYGKQTKSFTVASSTLDYAGTLTATTSLMLWNPQQAVTITDNYCKAFKGGSGTTTLAVGSGTATSTILCGSDVAGSASGLSISIAARGNVYFDFGGKVGTAAWFTPTISYTNQ